MGAPFWRRRLRRGATLLSDSQESETIVAHIMSL